MHRGLEQDRKCESYGETYASTINNTNYNKEGRGKRVRKNYEA